MKNKYVVLKWWASLTGLPVAKYCWVCETCERSSIEQLKGGSGAGGGGGGGVAAMRSQHSRSVLFTRLITRYVHVASYNLYIRLEIKNAFLGR